MSQNNSTILDFFSNYSNEPFEFVTVTDINLKEHPNYYKAIFRNIKRNSYHSQLITPEMMRYKYKVGHIYTNGEHVGKNKSVMTGEFTVNENNNIALSRLSQYITEDEVSNIIDYQDVSKYLLRQYVHVEENEEYTLLVPCYTIANRFYFLSSSMKHAIMTETLEALYYKGSFHSTANHKGETAIQVHIKKKAGKKDLPFLCRFIGSSFARARLEYLSKQKSLSSYAYQPVKVQFPVRNSFEVYASYIYLGNDKRDKPKYLVLNIHSDNSLLGYEELYYRQYSAKTDPKTVEPEQVNIPKRSKRKFKKKKPKRDSKIYTGTPSSEYVMHTLHMSEDEHFKHNVSIKGSTIYLDNENEINIENVQNTVGNSFETPASNGDENLGPTQATNDAKPKKSVKKIFNLMDFYQFYEALLTFVYVDGTNLLGPFEIKQVKNKKRKSIKSKSILYGDENKPRRFLFGEIAYNQKAVYIVEIEQDERWGPSTWIFSTSENTEQYTKDDMKDIIEHYIEKDLLYIGLKTYVHNSYNLSFNQKEHKKGDVDDDSIERWSESVLKKLYGGDMTF